MKYHFKKGLLIAIVVLMMAPKVYGARSMIEPPRNGDPIAILLVEQGIQQFKNQQLEASYTSFQLASQVDPNLSAADFDAAVAASEMGRTQEAISHLNEFTRRNPGHPEGQRFLSDLTKGEPRRNTFVGSGFAEFGLASLLGFFFMLAIAAFDIGGMPQYVQKAEEFREPERVAPRLRKVA